MIRSEDCTCFDHHRSGGSETPVKFPTFTYIVGHLGEDPPGRITTLPEKVQGICECDWATESIRNYLSPPRWKRLAMALACIAP